MKRLMAISTAGCLLALACGIFAAAASAAPKKSIAVSEFENKSGWHIRKRDIRSFLAFFLGFSDKWPKINAKLVNLHKYYDKKGIPELCNISGESALETWERICDEEK